MKSTIITFLLFFLLFPLSYAAKEDLCYSDFDGNRNIDFPDFLLFAQNFGKTDADTDYNNVYDLNENNQVDFPDFLIFARNYGKYYIPPCDNQVQDCYEGDVDCGGLCPTECSATKPAVKCSDGTESSSCSPNKPYFCEDGKLIKNCQECGCQASHECIDDGSCKLKACSDDTPYNSCSAQKPLFCNSEGELINDCSHCGCSPKHECREDGSCALSSCIPIIQNGDPAKKLDVLIIGDEYSDEQLTRFISDADKFIRELLSLEPFKSNQQKINFFRIDNTENIYCYYGCGEVDRCICCDWYSISRVASDCPHDQIIVIVNNAEYGGCASGITARSYNGWRMPRVAVHEFGHTFGKLRDEYSYGPYPGYDRHSSLYGDNCDKDPGCLLWVDLFDIENVGCFAGCQHDEWYRPIYAGSIMLDLEEDYNPVGERQLYMLMEGYK